MTARRVDWAFSGQDASPWPNASAIYYSDATIYLGQYIMVLATEYKLTNDLLFEEDLPQKYSNIPSLQKTQSLNELYYSIHELSMMNHTALFFRSNA